MSRRDPSTLSNYDCFRITHTVTRFSIDFDQKVLDGNVVLSVQSANDTGDKCIVLDTSYLDVQHVKVDQVSCKWDLQTRSEPLGSPLIINLERAIDVGETLEIDVSRQHSCCNTFR